MAERDISVYPRPGEDAIDHEPSEDCACGPTTVPLPTADGGVWWLYVHHGLTLGEMPGRDAYIEQMLDWAAGQVAE
jgi:hypothetical protein